MSYAEFRAFIGFVAPTRSALPCDLVMFTRCLSVFCSMLMILWQVGKAAAAVKLSISDASASACGSFFASCFFLALTYLDLPIQKDYDLVSGVVVLREDGHWKISGTWTLFHPAHQSGLWRTRVWKLSAWATIFSVFLTIQEKPMAKQFQAKTLLGLVGYTIPIITAQAHVAESWPRVQLQALQNSGSRMFM